MEGSRHGEAEGLLGREAILEGRLEGEEAGRQNGLEDLHEGRSGQTASKVARKHKKASVVIQKANGRIQEERTYPRSSDPRKTKG